MGSSDTFVASLLGLGGPRGTSEPPAVVLVVALEDCGDEVLPFWVTVYVSVGAGEEIFGGLGVLFITLSPTHIAQYPYPSTVRTQELPSLKCCDKDPRKKDAWRVTDVRKLVQSCIA